MKTNCKVGSKYPNFNLRDVIEILLEYDLVHQEFPCNKVLPFYVREELTDCEVAIDGLADDIEKKIHINKDVCRKAMRKTIIHEMLHCYHYLKGDYDVFNHKIVESRVDKETNLLFKHLYKNEP